MVITRHVSTTFVSRFCWSLAVVDRRLLFRGRFPIQTVRAGFGEIIVDMWPLIQVGL
jgi:hypothetical protein